MSKKYVVVVGDGMADWPLDELNGKTPLQVAETENMDFIAKNGRTGLLKTIPNGFTPGSDVANLSLLGYDPKLYYPGGRGPLEALANDIKLMEGDIAFRANLITVKDNKILDYSAGHISTEEARELIKSLNESLSLENVEFYSGISYRNLLILRNKSKDFSSELECKPPHDIVGEAIEKNLIKPKHKAAEKTAKLLNELMLNSRKILERHEINIKRLQQGKRPANMIWLWGQGMLKKLPSFEERFKLKGSIISGVDLIKGIGKLLGLEVIKVEGATGYLDTNYKGKAVAAIKSLKDRDFVYIHIEAPDEASHQGLLEEKIKAIERIDKLIVGKILDANIENLVISIATDHATPLKLRTHISAPVPFAVFDQDTKNKDSVESYDEISAAKGSFGTLLGYKLMEILFNSKIQKNNYGR